MGPVLKTILFNFMYVVWFIIDTGSHLFITFKSPEILAPASIPVAAGKKIANTEKKSCCIPLTSR